LPTLSDKTKTRSSEQSFGSGSNQKPQSSAVFQYYRHLGRAKAYVEANIREPVTLSRVAAEIGVSPSRLSHLYRDKLGVTFSQWVAELRVETAKRLLTQFDLPIADVVHESGFGSYRSFQRAFKKATGLSPSDYRSQHQPQIMADSQQQTSDS